MTDLAQAITKLKLLRHEEGEMSWEELEIVLAAAERHDALKRHGVKAWDGGDLDAVADYYIAADETADPDAAGKSLLADENAARGL